MPGSISIFKSSRIFVVLLLIGLLFSVAYAEVPGADNSKGSRTLQPEEEDFSSTPFTEYGEFNEEAEENEETRFFQYGRFVGVSLGTGFEGVTGNRGTLWQQGYPLVDFRLHYWFDFHFALDVGFFSAPHFYEQTSGSQTDHIDVNMTFIGLALKYYLDTKNLSAPISFANPYFSLGAGVFYKTELSSLTSNSDADSGFGMNGGVGLEFPVKPRRIYLTFEGRMYSSTFKDTFISKNSSSGGPPDLTGYFYTFTTNFLFTW